MPIVYSDQWFMTWLIESASQYSNQVVWLVSSELYPGYADHSTVHPTGMCSFPGSHHFFGPCVILGDAILHIWDISTRLLCHSRLRHPRVNAWCNPNTYTGTDILFSRIRFSLHLSEAYAFTLYNEGHYWRFYIPKPLGKNTR